MSALVKGCQSYYAALNLEYDKTYYFLGIGALLEQDLPSMLMPSSDPVIGDQEQSRLVVFPYRVHSLSYMLHPIKLQHKHKVSPTFSNEA